MDTKEQEQLFALWQKITLQDVLVQQWFDGLKRILHESNLAKVFMVFELWTCSNIALQYDVLICV